MPVNEPLMREAVANIERDPDTFDMETFITTGYPGCGTTMCLAGHALAAAGYTTSEIARIDGRGEVSDRAAQLLGLDPFEARQLFGYVRVIEENSIDGCMCHMCGRAVTIDDLKRKIHAMTGIEFKTEEDAA